MALAGDPVATGLVESLNRPGGNITGLAGMTGELAGKSVEVKKCCRRRIASWRWPMRLIPF